ncbi:RelA/SpoT family protein [Athalassotoga saccharophila]|uniref:RelA/SpoT family protein n=1 Tax=Athalassotoga saccharophila TaxID=1441386 RepID=UPI001379A889|nr:bifunctional (p)ppGpp synthetase/guanosine-3',5'-bis(diphosphate) 3'-pyrophosphohydrolase [Athalassotoga saccharophila]BBJ28183.1 GTP pyrophosphokinase [Athalassotoga saccharophila]
MESEENYKIVISRIIEALKKDHSQQEVELVEKAYEFAKEAHKNQTRASGELYISHPVQVAKIVYDMGMDIPSICTALLHDVAEDTDIPIEEIEKHFGSEIANMVNGLTKIKTLENEDIKFSEIETIRKMIFAMAQDMRVVLIKLADRLHNMRTIEGFAEASKRKEKARQTLEVYAPIANRLGIYTIKRELEDLSFKELYPQEYIEIKKLVDKKLQERSQEIEYYKSQIAGVLDQNGIEYVEISGRAKHFYSIWMKMKEKNKSFDEIYDLFAIRIVVKNIPMCYETLGVIHSLWTPVPGRFKDYIAAPKSNGYRALHNTVVTDRGEFLEIQIKDEQMNHEAEYGMAAHWKYKEGNIQKSEFIDKLLEWQRDYSKGLVGWKEMATEMSLDEVFVFTPTGEVKHLTKGSTPIDFAYSIHTDIGNHYAGASVNGRLVPMGYQLKDGDRVQIIVDRNSEGPNASWLKYAHSVHTRAKIKKFLRDKFASEYQEKGKEILRELSKKYHLTVEEILNKPEIKAYLKDRNIEKDDELELRLGSGAIKVYQIEKFLGQIPKPEFQHEITEPEGTEIVVDDLKGIEVRFAKCCNPVPGDRIVGVVTKNGISIHTADCLNLKNMDKNKIVKVSWGNSNELFGANIVLEGDDRDGLLNDIMNRIKEKHIQIVGVTSWVDDVRIAHIIVRVNVANLVQLNDLINHLKKEKGISKVYRERGNSLEGRNSKG